MKVIYKITSPSGRIYIGQSKNVKERFKCYRKGSYKSQIQLCRSFEKYGIENHVFKIIHELPDDIAQETFNEYEKLYIELYKNCGICLLNIKEGGSNGAHSEETLKKMALCSKGNKNMLGKKHSPETLLKISQSRKGKYKSWNTGKPWSDETKQKMSAARIGKEPWNKGKPGLRTASIETKNKMSESHKKMWDKLKGEGYVFKKGYGAGRAKLNRQQVSEIRNLLNDGISCKEIAPIFNVSNCTICDIKYGRTYNE